MPTLRPVEVYVDLPKRFGGRDPSVAKFEVMGGVLLPETHEVELQSFLTRLETELETRFGQGLGNQGGLSIKIDYCPMGLNGDPGSEPDLSVDFAQLDTFEIEGLGFNCENPNAVVPYEAVLLSVNFAFEAIARWYRGQGHAYGEDLITVDPMAWSAGDPPSPPFEPPPWLAFSIRKDEEAKAAEAERLKNPGAMGPDFGDDDE